MGRVNSGVDHFKAASDTVTGLPENVLDSLVIGVDGLDEPEATFRGDDTNVSRETASWLVERSGIERVDEHSLGRLVYGMEAACVLAGEFCGIETFTQPTVEWGKNAARGLLGADEFEEAAAVREKNRLIID